MREYLGDYVKEIDELIKKGKVTKQDIEKHLIKIKFFQHERLIHLIVTCLYAVMILLSIYIMNFIPMFGLIICIFLIFIIFYVRHYFFLENNVQYLYKQYDKMLTLKKDK